MSTALRWRAADMGIAELMARREVPTVPAARRRVLTLRSNNQRTAVGAH